MPRAIIGIGTLRVRAIPRLTRAAKAIMPPLILPPLHHLHHDDTVISKIEESSLLGMGLLTLNLRSRVMKGREDMKLLVQTFASEGEGFRV